MASAFPFPFSREAPGAQEDLFSQAQSNWERFLRSDHAGIDGDGFRIAGPLGFGHDAPERLAAMTLPLPSLPHSAREQSESRIPVYANSSDPLSGPFVLDAYRDAFDPLTTCAPTLQAGVGTFTSPSAPPVTGSGNIERSLVLPARPAVLQEAPLAPATFIPEPTLGVLTGLAVVWAGLRRRRPEAR